MITRDSIDKFFSASNIAVVGASRDNKKFGNSAYRYFKVRGYNVFPVNPNAERIDGDICYKSLEEIPVNIESALVVLPPEKVEDVVKLAHEKNINNIWLQKGAESKEAIKFCNEKEMNIVYEQCVLMFAEPSSFPHNFHRFVNKITGKIPR
jgi:predicted CoA-binding protein